MKVFEPRTLIVDGSLDCGNCACAALVDRETFVGVNIRSGKR